MNKVVTEVLDTLEKRLLCTLIHLKYNLKCACACTHTHKKKPSSTLGIHTRKCAWDCIFKQVSAIGDHSREKAVVNHKLLRCFELNGFT